MKVLFVDCYMLDSKAADFDNGPPSSMSIGYGVTSSRVLCDELTRSGVTLIRPLKDISPYSDGTRAARLRWVLRGYRQIADAAMLTRPDVIFAFHSFAAFPTEIRRILFELDLHIPIVAYTHGSHWDFSDLVRQQKYPGLELLDLANLACLDRVLFDSEFICDAVISNIATFNRDIADYIKSRSSVVGLPLDTLFIDSIRTTEKFALPTIVFNHAPVDAKDPASFIRVVRRVLDRENCAVLFTRAFADGDPGASELRELKLRFGERVLLGSDMPLDEYFDALWRADIQVSTALHESLGISTLEAMYTENCCLMPRRGSYPEISGNNSAALYESLDELEERLVAILRNLDLRLSIAHDLAKMAMRFRPAVVVPVVLRCLEEVCGQLGSDSHGQ